jgi:predicted amidohydrolase YtcJ
MGKNAIINASVYLGGGELIPKGFVTWEGSRIGAVGVRSRFTRPPDMEVSDLAGMLVLPGLIDSHIHLVGYALALRRIDLADTRSAGEALKLIADRVRSLRKGEWLRGRGWDKQRWGLESFPDRGLLDAVTPDNPAAITSRDGHLVWVNSAGLAELGLDRTGIEVEGGEVETDTSGRPRGVFKEKAAELVLTGLRRERPEEVGPAVKDACRRLLGMGITGVHASENTSSSELLDHAVDRGFVDLKAVRMLEVGESRDIDAIQPESRIGVIKILADGTLGSQTAAMIDPYCGQPENRGILAVSTSKLRELVFHAIEAGFSVAVHAIGDRANREILDVYEEARGTRAGVGAVLRIEHAQVLRPDDIARLGRLGVVASMQPIHLVGDMRVAERYWGARSRYAYAFRSILGAGGGLAFGSDAPIEDPNPLKGIHAAVTRRDPSMPDSASWNPAERITVSEAVDAYTIGAARAAGIGGETGGIRPGTRADLTVLDCDITRGDPDALLDARVVMTVVGGRTYLP